MAGKSLPLSQTVTRDVDVIRSPFFLAVIGSALTTILAGAPDADALIKSALAAEAKFDSPRALELFQEADKVRPDNAFVLQKIARQYSDMVLDQKTNEEKKQFAQTALKYAERSVELEPKNPVNVLSLAICRGTLGVYSDTRAKIQYSRQVKDDTERALALDPNYAWAHHVLGRWNYEVATLSSTSRFFVKMFYGGLPSASTSKAISELQRAVELEPNELEHVLELGFAYSADGQKEKARAEFERGLTMTIHEKHGEAAKERARRALARL